MGDMAELYDELDDRNGRDDNEISFHYTDILAETEKALLIRTPDGQNWWLPKSQIEVVDEELLLMPEWLYLKKRNTGYVE